MKSLSGAAITPFPRLEKYSEDGAALKRGAIGDGITGGGTGGAERRLRLFLRQKKLLETFLERRAITRAQYDRSLSCMASGMGIELDGSGAPIRRF